jgi:hypothetical protein
MADKSGEIERLYVSIGADVTDLLKETKQAVNEAEDDLEKFEKTGKRSFDNVKKSGVEFGLKVAAAIGAALAAIGSLVAGIKKATDAAIGLNAAQNTLAGSAAAAAREFGAVVGSSQSWAQTVKDLRAELKVFSEQELNTAAARLVDMSKRLGLTEEQMGVLLRRSADLAAGKTDLVGAIERTTSALRGEAESAEFLGLSLNENAVKAYAESQGMVWKELDDGQKAQQRYNLFLEQTNELQGRAAKFAETLAGSEAALNAEIEDQIALLGEQLLPLRQGYVEALKGITGETEGSASIITNVLAGIAAGAGTFVEAIKAAFTIAKAEFAGLAAAGQALINFENPITAAQEAMAQFQEEGELAVLVLKNLPNIASQAFDQIKQGWQEQRDAAKQAGNDLANNAPVIPPGAVDKNAAEIAKRFGELGAELLDLQAETNATLEKNQNEHNAAMAEIEAEGNKARLEINAKYDEQLAKGQADILKDARADLEKLQADTDRQLAQDRKDFQKDELRETEDHLKEMRELRFSFIDNLEDAVKDRDAGRVRDLRRQYERERQERTDDFNTQQSRDREDFSENLRQAIEAEDRRAQEIIDRRTEALTELEQRTAEGRQRELAQLDEALAERKQRETNNFNERQAELEQALFKRLETEAKALADQDKINEEGAQEILETLAEYFGEGGQIDKLMEEFAARRRQKMTLEIEFEGGELPTSPRRSSGGGNINMPQQIPTFQHGGTLLATRPTLAQFGETPELVQFMPLNQMRQNLNFEQTKRLEIDLRMSGSAPPGVRSTDRDAIAGVLANALREAGVMLSAGR